MRLNESKSEFIGAIIGDGNLWTDGRHYRVELTGDPNLDEKYYDYLKKIIRREFKETPSCKIRQRGLRLRICSKDLFNYLTKDMNLPSGSDKGKKVKIPEKITNSTWSIKSKCIRGITDTDGSFFFSKKAYREDYPTIEITTTSQMLSKQLKEILEKQEFRLGLRKWEHQRKKWNTRYVISINGDEMIGKWMEKIGFSNQRHYKKLNKIQL